MKNTRFRIKDVKLKKRNIFLIFIFLSCSSLILHLQSLTASVFADQNLAVSATVPPHASDFQFNFSSDGQTSVHQDTTLSYTITYGAQQSAGVPTTTTIVANFSTGTAPNASHVLDYVIGSATNAYNSTQPVVDLANKTITWTISNLPAGTTDQAVTFQLRTNSNYTGPKPVNFTILAHMNNQYLTLPDQTVSQSYQFQANTGSSNSSTVTPTPPSTSTPTPSPILSSGITGVSFPSISSSNATIQVNTSHPSKLTVEYGTSPNSLSHTVTTNSFHTSSIVTLDNLEADTTYYFRIYTKDASGHITTSEIFTFRTAKKSQIPQSVNGIAVISSNGQVILSQALSSPAGFVLLPTNTDYDITVSLSRSVEITSLEALVQAGSPLTTVSFVQKQPGVYSAHLSTLTSGTYQIFIRSTDNNGNVIEQQFANLKIIDPLAVYEKSSGNPITNARIYLTYYDTKTNSYRPLSSELFGTILNPSYTDSVGKINILLPPGKYRVEAGALFYDSQSLDFTLGPGTGQEFPKIYLTKDPFNLLSLLIYLKDLFIDGAAYALQMLHSLAAAVGLFNISAVIITGSFALLSSLLFTLKSHMSLKHLPIFLAFSVDLFLKKHKQNYLFGHIRDEDTNPLSRVRIEIEDTKTKNIIMHTTTHKLGKFYLPNTFPDDVTVIITKEGYKPYVLSITPSTQISDIGLQIVLEKGTPHHSSVFSSFIAGVEEGWGMLFETFLVFSLLLEGLFFLLYGFEKVLPFFVVSFLNINLWLFYLHERTRKPLI